MDCVFCKIISGEFSSYKIYEDNDIFVFLDINPMEPGHTLIIPKEHTLDLITINNDILIKILNSAKDMGKLLMEKMNADGFTLIQNNGISQEVKHYHLHVIPKYKKKRKMDIEEVYKILTN
ncbi:MAG: HIT domain-containing protein [Bacilli bacterium]|nr:HIT domain-containing protein [Bacilli bacterium]